MTDIDILPDIRDKDAATLAEGIPDELRGKTPEELQAFVDVLDAHLRSLHQNDQGELRDKSPVEQKAFDYGLKLRDRAITMIDENRAIQEVFKRRPKAVEQAMLNITYGKSDTFADMRRLTVPEARDRALRALDDRSSTMHLDSGQKSQIERHVRRDTDIARRILVTEVDAYRTAWQKLVTEPHPILDDDERKAVLAFQEYRAMSEGTTTAGGFGIPVMAAA